MLLGITKGLYSKRKVAMAPIEVHDRIDSDKTIEAIPEEWRRLLWLACEKGHASMSPVRNAAGGFACRVFFVPERYGEVMLRKLQETMCIPQVPLLGGPRIIRRHHKKGK
jgi:hypothetical protein